ncbi:zinc-binding protein A33 isoform X3 [Xenopus tropicalis]|uniref:Zinc-binding protein A33 isoform X3 n=1 Tax=Xenopus tropicalis TaxID=8364 RepID=A0A8J0SAC4_XENTR|nr:zinc-binding protein A33 isoform X3 [Xenopus tropicalis]|eukprot:XP_012809202.1 PREDICTED: zinc-binding protein A33-like isoform X1 [Xenopus tropicalis]
MGPGSEESGGKTFLYLRDNTWRVCYIFKLRVVTVIGSRSTDEGRLEDFYVRYEGSDPPQEEWLGRKCLVPLEEAVQVINREKRKLAEQGEELSKKVQDCMSREPKKCKPLEASESGLPSDVPEQLICPHCLDPFTDPVLLDCGHNLCNSCLLSILSNRSSSSCPRCLKFLSGQNCKPNYALGSLACQMKASSLAHPAQEAREGSQNKAGDQRQAKVWVPVGQTSCTEKHDNKASRMNQVQICLQQLRGQCEEQERCLSKLSEIACSLEQHLESQFSALQRFLQERKEKLQMELHQEVTEAQVVMKQELCRMRKEWQRIEKDLGTMMGERDLGALGKGTQLLTDRCAQMQDSNSPGRNLAQIENRLLGRFRGPVQFGAWRDMKAVLEPGLSCPRLDPDTAHPDLLLSEGNRRVSYFPVSRPPAISSTRFSQYLVALGVPKYKCGKHYWELEIGRNTECDVGLSLDCISHKDPFALTPADGCWVCSVRGGHHIVAFDSSPKVFKLPEKPRRMGVYLDYEGGQISFYNPQTMEHFYTFRASFRGSLCSYVSPCSVTDGETSGQLLRVFQDQL